MSRRPPNGGGSSQIKGGGRAILTEGSRQALVALLMRRHHESTQSQNDKSVQLLSFSSEREQQREEKRFVKNLVRAYERRRLARQVNGPRTENSAGIDVAAAETTAPSSAATSSSLAPNPETNKSPVSASSKVRVEIVEAIFSDASSRGRKGSHGNEEKNKAKGTMEPNTKFKEGTKKLMVVARSIILPELYKQAQAKLRMKQKPVRAFVVSTGQSRMLVELQRDLSGVSDGTVVYVTTTASFANSTIGYDPSTVSPMEQTREEPDSATDILADPLDEVKRAYARGQQRREETPRHQHSDLPSQSEVCFVDHEKAALLKKVREKLPAAPFRQQILHSIKMNPVVVICGSTGCGKSTQVPQFLYEQMKVDALACTMDSTNVATTVHPPTKKLDTSNRRRYIVVTQPRRVAAISLSHRVAAELGSTPPGAPGSLVGYIVRLDRRIADESCRIVYCTIGVLLRILICPPLLNECDEDDNSNFPPPLSLHTISHLIVDEVHERDVNTDFSLTLLKGLLPSSPHLRLILMSATASSYVFVNYFSSLTKSTPPVVLEIPGRTFPVQIQWLSDCERFAEVRMLQNPEELYESQGNYEKSLNQRDEGDKGNAPILSPRAVNKIDNQFIRSLIRKIVHQQQAEGYVYSKSNNSARRGVNEFEYRDTGAILVFLPGRSEIDSLARCLYDDRTLLGDRDICRIFKLHSAIPRSEQQNVFQPARSGTVKIILSTNLAESSVTISDVTHIIDTLLVKESRFNCQTRIKELVTVYCSRASAIQRAGRAGRTSKGTCWRLISDDFWGSQLLAQTPPEMIRTPLDQLVLQLSLLYEQRRDEFLVKAETENTGIFPPGLCPIQFLSKTPTPPPESSLVDACRHLLEVDALRVVECDAGASNVMTTEASWFYRLTPLGYHLSRLPMDAKVGKVLISGCTLGCLDGALTIAASLSCTKSCFVSARGGSATQQLHFWDAAVQARAALVENGFGGPDWKGGTVKGDLIAVIAAYNSWRKLKSEKCCRDFCKSHALDNLTLKEMDQLRQQFLELLVDAGFVSRTKSTESPSEIHECNQASEDALLTSCCLVAGLYPNICTLMRPRKGGPKGGRLLTKEGDICRAESNSFQLKRLEHATEVGKDAYGVFHGKHQSIGTISKANAYRTPQVFLSEINFVSRFALLLFGGELDIVNNAIIVDGWLKFKVSGCEKSGSQGDGIENAVLIQCLREALDDVMREHVLKISCKAQDRAMMRERHKVVIDVVRRLLSDEG